MRTNHHAHGDTQPDSRRARRLAKAGLAILVTAGLVLSAAQTASATTTPGGGTVNGGATVTVDVPGAGFAKVFGVSVNYSSATIFALTANNLLYAWGANSTGQYGDGTTTAASSPKPVTLTGALAGKTITQISSGGSNGRGFALFLTSDGTVAASGYNASGQLGNGTTTASSVPVAVTTAGTPMAGKTITRVVAGVTASYALASDGTVYSWGYGTGGQLGNGGVSASSVPVAVTTAGTPMAGKTITQLAAGYNAVVALASDGSVFAWGYNGFGELGNSTATDSSVPVAVTASGVLSGQTVTTIAMSAFAGYAVTSSGAVFSWGYNQHGSLGDGTTTTSMAPVAVDMSGVLAGKTVTAITGQYEGAQVLTSDGGLYGWGLNGNSDLGNGSTTNSTSPVAVTASGVLTGQNITSIAASSESGFALSSTGELFSWGQNTSGQLGDGSAVNASTPIAVTLPTIAVKFDGTSATSVTRVSPSRVTVVTPAHAPGAVDVVTTVGGNANYSTISATQTAAYSYGDIPVITTTTLPDPVVGTAYSATVAASGNPASTYAVSSGALPAGLTLNASSGAISGTPTTLGSSTFSIVATNVAGSSAPQSFTVAARTAPVVTTTTLPDPLVGIAYSQTLTATGDGTPAFAVATGALPTGLALSAAGLLSGTPTAEGSFTFTVTATTTYGVSPAVSYTLTTHSSPAITTTTLANPAIGTAYSALVAVTGSGTPTFSVTSGSLPAGLTLDSASGVISGTPTAAGTFTFTVQDSTGYGTPATQSYTVTVAPTMPTVTTTTLPDGVMGTSYSGTLAVTGTPAPTFTVSSGALPTGLALDTTTGAITGIPTDQGVFNFTIDATNSGGTASQPLQIAIFVPPVITTTTLSDPVVGVAYSQSVIASGSGVVAFAVGAGTLPAGLSLSAAGVLSGTPTAAGPSTFTVTASSVYGSVSQPFTVVTHTAPAITTPSLAIGSIGVAYSQTIVATGSPTISFAVTAGTLPAGLTLDTATGVLSGAPTTAGAFTFTATASSAYGSASQAYTVAISLPVITTTTLPNPVVGVAYSQTVVATGPGPISLAVTSGTLPSGLSLDGTTGVIAGTVTAAGTSTFQVTASNPDGGTSQMYTLVAGAAPVITTTSVPDPIVGAAYSQTVAATGDGTLAFSVSAGALPAGVTLAASTGVLSGNPTAAGPASFAVTATSGYGVSTVAYTVTVRTAPVITTTSLPNMPVGTAYSQMIAATGSATIAFVLTSGSLPVGVSLNSATGALTGMPTAAGSATFEVTATSAYGSSSRTYQVAAFTPPAITTTTLTDAVTSVAYTGQIVATGTGPITYSVGTGLPAGLALDVATGAITGTPTASATAATFTVTATSPYGSATRALTLAVHDRPRITTTALSDGIVGVAYAQTVVATGSGVLTYAVVTASLPAGVKLNTATGALSGTPTAAGSSTFSVKASSPYGSDTATFTLVVGTAPVITTRTLAGAVAATAYSATVVATGPGTLAYAVASGSLPAGLALNAATGALSGTPKSAGTSSFSVKVSSAYGSATQALKLVVAAPAPTLKVTVSRYASGHTPYKAGSKVAVKVSGLKKLEKYSVTISGVVVAKGTATSKGTVSTKVTIPKTFGAGTRQVLVLGTKVKGKAQIKGSSVILTKKK